MDFVVIEDQQLLREILNNTLIEAGFNVQAFESAEDFYAQDMSLNNVQMAIVDITLPGMSGLELSRQLRQAWPHLGIIILSMHKGIDKKLQGYAAGADFYLTKPIENQELVATCKALIKRVSPNLTTDDTVLEFDPIKQKLTNNQKVSESLSYKEARTLNAFLHAQKYQLEYWQLLELNQLELDEKGRKQLEVMISRLRHKLEKLIDTPHTIKSIRGYGYQLLVAITQAT
ncbi:MAG: response regulator transcription factor [Methyloprofundus sp.]|nr:response regulator transcription factor [Methyloprofundus sp.]